MKFCPFGKNVPSRNVPLFLHSTFCRLTLMKRLRTLLKYGTCPKVQTVMVSPIRQCLRFRNWSSTTQQGLVHSFARSKLSSVVPMPKALFTCSQSNIVFG